MIEINSEILKQFHYHGITINNGVAVDARLVKSASRPISKRQIKGLKEHLDTPESRLGRNGNLKKFSRCRWITAPGGKNQVKGLNLPLLFYLIPQQF